MTLQIFHEAVARRRQENGGCSHLSDWQVHSAQITASAISILARGLETGPLYVPMPTGSGKTTGAVWGITDLIYSDPSIRICFLTPYKSSVDQVYFDLVERLDENKVGYYYSGALVDKRNQLSKQVIVLTHQFVQFNQGQLDDRDLFIVDEAIYATGEATLKLSHFFDARSWATSNNIFPEEFTRLSSYAIGLDEQLRVSGKKYVAADRTGDLTWARTIAYDLTLSEHSQLINNNELLVSCQRFCEALLQGLVFLSKGSHDSERYDPIYSAAVLGIPKIEKTVVLSATGGMIYDIAGPFKQDQSSLNYWTPPSYQRLKLVQMSGPNITGHYRTWNSTAKKDKAVRYVDWVLQQIEEQEIYFTAPKQVIEKCLREYFNQSNTGDLEYPFTVNKHGKTVHVSHHARSIGSNLFADCKAVVYLWDNHLPQSTAVQKFHTLANEEITEEALEDANGGVLVGNYQRIRNAQYIDNMMQQIGRGSVRRIDENATAGEMTAYIHTETDKLRRLAIQYRDCNIELLEYEGSAIGEPSGRLDKIIWHLKELDRRGDVSGTEIEEAIGFEMRRYRQALENSWDLRMLGYTFEAGGRGRGRVGKFKWTEGS